MEWNMKIGTARTARLLALSALVAATAITSGCAKSAAGTAATDSGPKPVVLKIGVGAPLTAGVVAYGKGSVNVTKLAAEKANASERAKKLGVTFEVVEGDDQGDPKVGVTVANVFASNPKLVGVVGHINSGVSIPASKVYNDAKLVVVTSAATNPTLTDQGFNNVFRTCTVDTVQGTFAADKAAKDLGYKRAVVIDDSTPYGEGLATYFGQQFKADGGDVVLTEKTSDKDSDFTALVTKIKAANPDVIYYGGLYNAGSLLTKQLKEGGVSAPLFGGDGFASPDYIKLAGGAAAEGDFSTQIGLPLDTLPSGAEFKTAYESAYPGVEITPTDAYGYDAAQVIINAALTAAEKVGADKVTTPAGRDAIIAAAAATDFEGVTGKVAFDAKGDTRNKAVTLLTVKNGEWTTWTK